MRPQFVDPGPASPHSALDWGSYPVMSAPAILLEFVVIAFYVTGLTSKVGYRIIARCDLSSLSLPREKCLREKCLSLNDWRRREMPVPK